MGPGSCIRLPQVPAPAGKAVGVPQAASIGNLGPGATLSEHLCQDMCAVQPARGFLGEGAEQGLWHSPPPGGGLTPAPLLAPAHALPTAGITGGAFPRTRCEEEKGSPSQHSWHVSGPGPPEGGHPWAGVSAEGRPTHPGRCARFQSGSEQASSSGDPWGQVRPHGPGRPPARGKEQSWDHRFRRLVYCAALFFLNEMP